MKHKEPNPWVTRPRPAVTAGTVELPSSPTAPPGPARPQPWAMPSTPPAPGIRVRVLGEPPQARWWFVGAHGGAGASTLSGAYEPDGARDAGVRWPLGPEGAEEADFTRVVLVARTSAHGLTAAQGAAWQWAAGRTPRTTLLGLVLVADAPGRLPRELAQRASQLAGGVPHCWRLPWLEQVRLGVRLSRDHRALGALTAQLRALTSNGGRDG